jgi:hypothetical protein
VKSAKTQSYTKISKYTTKSLSKELLLHASLQKTVVARQWPVNSNRGKVFSAGPCDATVEELFRDVFSMGPC